MRASTQLWSVLIAVAAAVVALLALPIRAGAVSLTAATDQCVFQQKLYENFYGEEVLPPTLIVEPGLGCSIEVQSTSPGGDCPPIIEGFGDDKTGPYYEEESYYEYGWKPTGGPLIGSSGHDVEFGLWVDRHNISVFSDYEQIHTLLPGPGQEILGTNLLRVSVFCPEGEGGPDHSVYSDVVPITMILRGPDYDPLTNPGAGAGNGSGGNPIDAENLKRVRGLEGARNHFVNARRGMRAAQHELEEKNAIFCGTVARLSLVQSYSNITYAVPVHHVKKTIAENALEHFVVHGVCEQIPKWVDAVVDADRKLEQNEKMIKKLDQEIGALEARRGATVKLRAPLGARRQSGGRALAEASVFRLFGTDVKAVGREQTRRASKLAGVLASSLRQLSRACRAATRYGKRIGLGGRISRASIAKALSLPLPSRKELALGARRLHMTRAQIRRAITRGKAVPKRRIRPTSASELICSSGLSDADKVLAGAFAALARGS
jgi:hypothetical protein